MNNPEDRQVGDAARRRFELGVQSLPAATANRLRLARRAALSAPRAAAGIGRWMLPLGTTAALVLALAWWQQAPEHSVGQASAGISPASGTAFATRDTAGVSGIAAPAAVANEDDADLYAWLADTPVAVDASRDGSL